MKLRNRILEVFIVCFLLPTSGFTQAPPFVVAYPAGTPMANGTPGVPLSATVDKYGVLQTSVVGSGGSGLSQSVIPVSNNTNLNGVPAGSIGWTSINSDLVETGSTTTVINATAHVARVGDVIFFSTGTAANARTWSPVSAVTANTITLTNALPTAALNGDGFYVYRPVPIVASFSVTGGTAMGSFLDFYNQNAASTGILKLEDSAAASGDALVAIAGERNDSLGNTKTGSNTEYGTIAIGNRGEVLSAGAMNEDVAPFDQMYTAVAGFVREDALTVNTGTTGEVTWGKADAAGRLITTLAPAGETWAQCSAAETGTAAEIIKNSVASNRIYVTSISCSNTAAVASIITFHDGSTTYYGGALPSNTSGGIGQYTANFSVPLRLGVATNLNFQLVTTATSTICCASGYISVN